MDDTNDNPPVFEESVYSFDIPENAPRGYQVGEIVAKDVDLAQNAQVSYAVVSDWANDVFSLNPQTGALTLTAKLDYEDVRHSTFSSVESCVSHLQNFFLQTGAALHITCASTGQRST